MKELSIGVLFFLIGFSIFAQNDSVIPEQVKHKPTISPWPTTTLIDKQTTTNPVKGHLELVIHHRFTAIDNGITDLFGFYGASNIRLGLNYGITDRLMIGIGSEKDKKMQEFSVKYNFLQQSKDNYIPVSMSLFANTCINSREEGYFGADYKFMDRMSYYSQLIVSRKWTTNFATQIGIGYAHINKVESTRVVTEDSVSETIAYYPKYYNDALGFSISARYKIAGPFSIIAEFEQPLALGKHGQNGEGQHDDDDDDEEEDEKIAGINKPKPLNAKPNLAVGFEITTVTHSFQMFVSSFRGIVPQNNLIMNNFDFTDKSGIMLGFNVVVKF
jgi:hypothetical protein